MRALGRPWFAAFAMVTLFQPAFGQTTTASLLGGTSWQLIRFEGGDGTVITPDDGANYTLAFNADGSLAARIDCNRGRGSWKSSAPSQIALGPLALTRAMCPPQSMHDQIVKQLPNIRSYVLKGGHLYLALMADGGIYEFQPIVAGAPAFKSPVKFRGPVTFTCANQESVRVTFYETQPAMAILERGGESRPAFQVRAASGSRYEGDGVLFWEARGEATVSWMGVESTCKPI